MAEITQIRPAGVQAQPNTSVARYSVPDLDAAALATAQEGQVISRGADEIYAAVKVETQKQDTLVAEDAYNQLQQKRLDLTYGQNGFTNKKGADAANKPIIPEYSTQFRDAADAIGTTLKNPDQARMFAARRAVADLSFQEDLLKHVTVQNNVYAKDVFDGTLKVETQNVVANWDNRPAVEMSMSRVENAVKLIAEKNGLPPEAKEAMRISAMTDMNAAIIDQAIKSGNNAFAEGWYNEHRKDIDLKTAKVLEMAVRDGAQKDVFNAFKKEQLAIQDDPVALEKLQGRVETDKTLNLDRQNALVNSIQNRRMTLEARSTAQQTRIQATMEKGLSTLEANALNGFDVSDDQIQPYVDAARGNPILESRVRQVLQTSAVTRAVRLAPLAEGDKLIAKLTADARGEGPAAATPSKEQVMGQLVANIRQVESGGNPNAVSIQGAQGSMQIIESTFNDYKKPGEVFTNEKDRVAAALRKIDADYDFYKGDVSKVAAAYIGGRGAVREDGTIRDDVKDALGTTPAAYAAKVAKGIVAETKRDRFDVQLLGRLQAIQDSKRQALKLDPVNYAVKQGLVEMGAPGTVSFDMSAPDKIDPEQMSARFGLARGMEAGYGANFKPLTIPEAELATATVRRMSNDQKSQYFGNLAKAAKQDMDGYKALVGQIAPDRPEISVMGIYAAYGRATTDFNMEPVAGQPKAVATLIGAGLDILYPNKKEDGDPSKGSLLPMPSEPKMQLAFDDYVRDAYAGNGPARSTYYQTAKAIYAKLSVDAGDKNTAEWGGDQTDRWKKAIQLATGGIENYKGKQLPMPFGKTIDQFSDQVNRRLNEIIASGRMPPEITPDTLKSLPLKVIADGVYVLRAGDGIQGDKFGMPIRIDLNKGVYDFKMEEIGNPAQREKAGVKDNKLVIKTSYVKPGAAMGVGPGQ